MDLDHIQRQRGDRRAVTPQRMEILTLTTGADTPNTAYAGQAAFTAACVTGEGEAHLHTVRLEAGGVIGPHPTGFGQLFVLLAGTAA